MPELPEVETICRQLAKHLPLTIKETQLSREVGSILKPKDRHFEPTGNDIQKIERHGKMMDFILTGNWHILSHLGMSGGWRISSEKIQVKHTHLQFRCLNKHHQTMYLAYVDPRRFGSMKFFSEENVLVYKKKMGVDIGSQDFTAEYIYRVCKSHPDKILKPFLLDQRYFAGLGNYLASEICGRAGLRPTRRCKSISKNLAIKLQQATKSILKDSIKNKGLTFSGGYSDAQGEKGEGVKNLVVFYQKICGICNKTAVKKITLQGRGTYYCPQCQH